MRLSKLTRYLIYVLFGVFIISRMWVAFHEYMEMGYSPLSTYATLALILLSLLAIGIQTSNLFRSKLNKRVFLFLLLSMLSTFLLCNPTMDMMKQLMYVTLWEAVFFLFFFLSYNDEGTSSEMRWMMIILLIPVTFLFIRSNSLRVLMNYGITRQGNNAVFYVVLLFPWLLLSSKRWLRLAALLFIVAVSVLSLKRSAMFIAAGCVLVVFYFEFLKDSQHRLRSLLFGLAAFIAGYCLIDYINSSNQGAAIERIAHIEEDKGSGRLDRFAEVIELIKEERDPVKIVFGHGYRSVELNFGSSSSAHNDFLEVAYDYGFLGLIIYLAIHLALLAKMISLWRAKSQYTESYASSYCIFIVMSMVSHLIIYPTYFVLLASYWGAVEGAVLKDGKLTGCTENR